MLFVEIISAILIVTLISYLGFLILNILGVVDGWLRIISLSFPIGAGIFSFIIFIFSWVGIPITPMSVFSLYLLTLSTIFLFGFRSVRAVQFPSIKVQFRGAPVHPGILILWMLIGAVFLVIFLISIGRSYASWDGAAQWAVKGYAIAALGSVEATSSWGMWGATYPLNVMLQISLFKLFGPEMMPASKVIFPIYFITGSLGVYRYWSKHRVPKVISLLAILFIAFNPVMFYQATNGYANVIFAFLVILAINSLIDGILEESRAEQLIGGIFLGIATWTRPEGIAFSLLIILALMVTRLLVGRGQTYLIYMTGPVLISSIWLIFSWHMDAADQLGSSIRAGSAVTKMINGILVGNPRISILIDMITIFIRRAVNLENWGTFLPVLLIGAFLGLIELRRRPDPHNLYLIVACLTLVAIPFGIYYAISFDPYMDFELILRGDFDRAFLPAFLMLIVTIVSFWGEAEVPKWMG